MTQSEVSKAGKLHYPAIPCVVQMDLIESTTHSFIIKVWLDKSLTEGTGAGWHGHITHVPSGTRRYLKDLNEITVFIEPFLEESSANLSLLVRLKRWLGKLKL